MQKHDNLIFGIRTVIEAIKAGKEIDKVLLKRGSGSDNFREMLGMLRQYNVPTQTVPVEKLNAVTRKSHQGVIAYLSQISYSDITMLLPSIYESGENPLILLLDRVTDVRNFGAIARTAECSGVHAIILPKHGSARINAEAIKTSAGALHRIAVCRHESLENAAKYLKDSGLRIMALSEKANSELYSVKLKGPLAIIMGAEDHGISKGLLQLADQIISIPMKGGITSLNVSVATGIVLFEALRQRRNSTQEVAGD